MAAPAQIRIGISGFRYPNWRGVFYPKGLTQKRELEYVAEQMNSLEINGSFYSLQRPELYQRWYQATPDDFVFAVKGGRFITHLKRLREIETPLANFFASGILNLKQKLGPILWQFPERIPFDDRFQAFFELLPRDTVELAKIARSHDHRLSGRSVVEADQRRPVRHAIELRHVDCQSSAVIELLRRYDIALVVADTAGRWPYLEDVTADFVYVRLHGDTELYASGYAPKAIRRWAERVCAWSQGREPEDAVRCASTPPPERALRDVYVYFDNDIRVRAPFDAIALQRAVNAKLARPEPHSRPESPPLSAPSRTSLARRASGVLRR